MLVAYCHLTRETMAAVVLLYVSACDAAIRILFRKMPGLFCRFFGQSS